MAYIRDGELTDIFAQLLFVRYMDLTAFFGVQNSLFNSALKQSSAIRRDLDIFAESPATTSAALQGVSCVHARFLPPYK